MSIAALLLSCCLGQEIQGSEVFAGVVVDAATDAPVPQARVRVREVGHDAHVDVAAADGSFAFRLRGVDAVEAIAEVPGFAAARWSDLSVGSRWKLELSRTVAAAGRVVDVAGHPIAAARVTLDAAPGSWLAESSAISAADGTYSLAVVPGLRWVRVESSGGATVAEIRFDLEQPRIEDAVIGGGAELEIRVVAEDGGKPIAGADVALWPRSIPFGDALRLERRRIGLRAATDGAGVASCGPVPPDTWCAYVQAPGFADRRVEFQHGATRGERVETVRLAPEASIEGVVTCEGEPEPWTSVSLTRLSGERWRQEAVPEGLPRLNRPWGRRMTWTDDAGRFQFDGLSSEPVRVTCSTESQRLVLHRGDRRTFDLQIERWWSTPHRPAPVAPSEPPIGSDKPYVDRLERLGSDALVMGADPRTARSRRASAAPLPMIVRGRAVRNGRPVRIRRIDIGEDVAIGPTHFGSPDIRVVDDRFEIEGLERFGRIIYVEAVDGSRGAVKIRLQQGLEGPNDLVVEVAPGCSLDFELVGKRGAATAFQRLVLRRSVLATGDPVLAPVEYVATSDGSGAAHFDGLRAGIYDIEVQGPLSVTSERRAQVVAMGRDRSPQPIAVVPGGLLVFEMLPSCASNPPTRLVDADGLVVTEELDVDRPSFWGEHWLPAGTYRRVYVHDNDAVGDAYDLRPGDRIVDF